MVLVDTSVWVNHLNRVDEKLRDLLLEDKVLTHPMIVGEIACGEMQHRRNVLALLGTLLNSRTATNAEVLNLIEQHALYGQKLGWIDVHLLASCRLTKCPIWTYDKTLLKVAAELGIDIL